MAENVDEEITKPEEGLARAKNFKCSICMKKFRKSSLLQVERIKFPTVFTSFIAANIEYIKKHLVKIHGLTLDSQKYRNYLELSNCDSDDELDDCVKCYICGKSYG